ncbi:YbgA family protein [Methanothermobacter sp.]|uniref:YbgA family protein n=1 Tax=Methanothermobacter sp. TaxID=1884223 RepID=UPI003C75CBEB
MRKFRRPVLVLSRCIEHDHCRYDGSMISSPFVRDFGDHADFVTVCPEVEIGLGVPRPPIHIRERDGELRLVQPETGRDITSEMRSFTESFLNSLEVVDGFILKNRSPSCGIRNVKVYHGEGQRPGRDGMGFFGRAVMERFPHMPLEDEGRLRNLQIREDFLIRVYLLRDLRGVKTLQDLIEFHTKNKLLLMSLSPDGQNRLGRVIAEQKDLEDTIETYSQLFCRIMEGPIKPERKVNALLHAFGHFSSRLNGEERRYFLKSIEWYRRGVVPMLVPLSILRAWVARFDETYLREQTFFEPYPRELVPVTIIS